MKVQLKASRRALDDARRAFDLFQHPEVEFQLIWTLNAAFLGIVADALHKVDKSRCGPDGKKLIDAVWMRNREAAKDLSTHGMLCSTDTMNSTVARTYSLTAFSKGGKSEEERSRTSIRLR